MNKVAGAVFGFKRPEYLKKTLDSLSEANKVFPLDWFYFQDGGYNRISRKTYATDGELTESAKVTGQVNEWLWTAKVENYENRGIARQKDEANKLFESYEKVFFFEEDMIVSPYYIRLLNLALDQYPNHMIYLYNHPSRGYLDSLELSGIARLWGYGMTASLFSKMRDDWNFYASLMDTIDYKKRSGAAPELKRMMEERTGIGHILHDVVVTNLARKHGSGKLNSTVSRGYYIGKDSSISGGVWEKRQFDKQTKNIIFKEDENLKEFKIV